MGALSWLDIGGLNFHQPAKIDCILGDDVFPAIIREGIRVSPTNTTVAQATALGWIITGQSGLGKSYDASTIAQGYHTLMEPSLSETLLKFWEIEEIHASSCLSPDDLRCEEYFKETVFRDEHGRFVVRYPFTKKSLFPDSRDVAVACLLRSERRKENDPQLDKEYCNFMEQYLTLGHTNLLFDYIHTQLQVFVASIYRASTLTKRVARKKRSSLGHCALSLRSASITFEKNCCWRASRYQIVKSLCVIRFKLIVAN